MIMLNLKSLLAGLRQFLTTGRSLKMMKNALYFLLSHYVSVFHFYTPWKNQEARGFLIFSGGIKMNTAWKVSKYGVFSGPYFPAFGLNTYLSVFHAVGTLGHKGLKVYFVFQIVKFCLGYLVMRENGLIEKKSLILAFMTSQTGQ